MDLAALKAELDNDPLGRGYSGMDDVEAAESLNQRDRNPPRESVDAGLLMGALVESEYNDLPARGKAYFGLLVAAGTIDVTDTLKTQILAMFGAGTATRTNLIAAFTRPGSRAEELDLGRVTPSTIADARRLP